MPPNVVVDAAGCPKMPVEVLGVAEAGVPKALGVALAPPNVGAPPEKAPNPDAGFGTPNTDDVF